MAKIIIPSPLRKFTGDTTTVETEASTVLEAIQDLTKQHSGLSQHILDKDSNIRSFIRIYVGDEDINVLDKGATKVESDTVISIVPAIAGG